MSPSISLLLTGSSGFIGRNILPILSSVYQVTTWKRPYENAELRIFDVVLHCAGLAHTRGTLEEFMTGNYENTRELCERLKQNPPKHFVFLSTVAVYGCERGEGIVEEHPLIGNTPYAISKIKAEQFLEFWCKKHEVRLSILRISLVAGKNPPGNLGLMIRGIQYGFYVSINGGMARKSMVMAEDIARIIPLLEREPGVYNLCADYAPSFRELELLIVKKLHKREPLSIPYWIAKRVLGKERYAKMCNTLTFSNEKAKNRLDWKPLVILDKFNIER